MSMLRVRARAGFTLIELMIGLAVMAVLVVLVGPSFMSMIDMQRLRGTSAQFVTDVQFARTEAISRGQRVGIQIGSNASMTCYIVHTCGFGVQPSLCSCDCTLDNSSPATQRCNPPQVELRTVQLPAEQKITIAPARNPNNNVISFILFSPLDGGMEPWNIGVGGMLFALDGPAWAETSLVRNANSPKTLRTMVSQAGRPSVCTPATAQVLGTSPCN